jgi:hypothetical protein
MRNAPYSPGEKVPETGIYRVIHETHRLMHMATLLRFETFPICKRCRDKVRFAFVRRVEKYVPPFRAGEILDVYPRKGIEIVDAFKLLMFKG